MSRQSYHIAEAVHGTYGLRLGVSVDFDYEVGEVTPKDADEEAVLAYLVSVGRAEPVAAKAKKKEA